MNLERRDSLNNQKPSSLFWSWGAYVFLPINIIIGTIISKEGASIEEMLWALILALVLNTNSENPLKTSTLTKIISFNHYRKKP